MTVPIATSPGRSGFGSQLSLSYDSGAGNGPFGFGWPQHRHLKSIKYGNQTSRLIEADLSKVSWIFEVVFDYDEGRYERLPSNAQGQQFVRTVKDPTQQWSVRQDPFSNYRAGFELRTYRLCYRVLMFHHFSYELGTDDCLVRSTELTYQQSPVASFMTSVSQSGYVRKADEAYLKQSLPPLEFTYSQCTLNEKIQAIGAESLENLPYGLGWHDVLIGRS